MSALRHRPAHGRGGRGAGVPRLPDAHAGRAARRCRTTPATTTWWPRWRVPGRSGSQCGDGRRHRGRHLHRPRHRLRQDRSSTTSRSCGTSTAIVAIGPPVVVGVSRKRFLGAHHRPRGARPGGRRPGHERDGASRRARPSSACTTSATPATRSTSPQRSCATAMSGLPIEIPGLEVFAHHGVPTSSAATGRCSLSTCCSAARPRVAGTTDDLADAVNYGAVARPGGGDRHRGPLRPARAPRHPDRRRPASAGFRGDAGSRARPQAAGAAGPPVRRRHGRRRPGGGTG